MKAKTFLHLKFINQISNNDIQKVMSKTTFYNIINGETNPTEKTKEKMCELFKIEEKEYFRLLKNIKGKQ